MIKLYCNEKYIESFVVFVWIIFMSRSFIEVNQSLVQQPEWMVLYSTISIQMIVWSDFNTLEYEQLIEYVEWQQRMFVYVFNAG